jgi:hypothetical protein
MAKKHSKRKHSQFPASSSERWIECPGSVQASETAPKQIESEPAREGTLAHECLEYLVRNLGTEVLPSEKGWTDEMVEHAADAAKLIYDLRPTPTAKLLIEQRVVFDSIDDMFGTLDYAWIDEDWGNLVVIDYKYGRGLVLPQDADGNPNPQLMYYASALLKQYGYDFDKITLAIIQPRLANGGAITVDVPVDRILQFEVQVEKAVALANSKSPPFKAGKHCRYCPAALTCSTLSASAMGDAGIVFDLDTTEIIAMPEVRTVDALRLGRMLAAADVLDVWIKAVREYAYVSAQRGEKIEGFKLVPKRAVRSWLDGAEKEMEKTFGKHAFSVKKCFLTPAELERVKGSEGKAFTSKYAKAISSGYNLVSEGDSRPGVELGSAFDYD